MPKKIQKETSKEERITFRLEKEVKNKYNESHEKTLDNIYAMAAFTVKNYGRAGYQIKLLEQILDELKILNKGKK